MITLITACSSNRAIGKDNKLLWHLPDDLKRFKSLTLNKPILMGKMTYLSIGKPLLNRTNIVLSRDKNLKLDGCLVYNNIHEVLPIFRDIMVIGGGQIYKDLLPFADKIELTLIHKEYDGDTFFPELDSSWIEVNREDHKNDSFEYSYITYELKK